MHHTLWSRSGAPRFSIVENSVFGVEKVSLNAQSIENLTNLQDLNSSSKCKVAVLKTLCEGGNDIEQRCIHDKSIELSWQSKERFKPLSFEIYKLEP